LAISSPAFNSSLVLGVGEFFCIENMNADRKRAIVDYVYSSEKWRNGVGPPGGGGGGGGVRILSLCMRVLPYATGLVIA